eukprot:Amastigsp_a340255_353.p3 type:complete len:123 gc:universal Amastigsp_a340255_353:265-633(+)
MSLGVRLCRLSARTWRATTWPLRVSTSLQLSTTSSSSCSITRSRASGRRAQMRRRWRIFSRRRRVRSSKRATISSRSLLRLATRTLNLTTPRWSCCKAWTQTVTAESTVTSSRTGSLPLSVG